MGYNPLAGQASSNPAKQFKVEYFQLMSQVEDLVLLSHQVDEKFREEILQLTRQMRDKNYVYYSPRAGMEPPPIYKTLVSQHEKLQYIINSIKRDGFRNELIQELLNHLNYMRKT